MALPYCPILSFMKANPCICLAQHCAWWTGEACAILAIAEFFQERRHYPNSK